MKNDWPGSIDANGMGFFSAIRDSPYGILFSSPMVRAILNGSKTQTRRLVKHSKQFKGSPSVAYDVLMSEDGSGAHFLVAGDHGFTDLVPCPYGVKGERLYVKETAIIAPKRFAATPDDTCINDADGDPRYIQYIASQPDTEAAEWYKLKKTPSIFMPRWASRITLEITEVRVERLNDISEEDAVAEGVFRFTGPGREVECLDGRTFFYDPETRAGCCEYRSLWESINGPKSWDLNSWVWCIAFKRLNPPTDVTNQNQSRLAREL